MQSNIKRDTSLDVVGGIMLVWMMLGHSMQFACATNTLFYAIVSQLFFCFMAWFFFKGGMFAKKEPFKKVFIGGFKRLIIPFVLFSALGLIVHWILLWMDGIVGWKFYIVAPIYYFLKNGCIPGNIPLWFLITLFLVRLAFNCLIRWKFSDYLLGVLLIIFYIVKYLNVLNIGDKLCYPLYLYNGFVGLIFFWLGFRLKQTQYYSKFFGGCVVALLIVMVVDPAFYDLRTISIQSDSNHGDFMVYVLSAVAACVVFNYLFRFLSKKIQFKYLQHIGFNSMIYYCFHWIILVVIKSFIIVPMYISEAWQQTLMYIIGLLVLLPISRKLIVKLPIAF